MHNAKELFNKRDDNETIERSTHYACNIILYISRNGLTDEGQTHYMIMLDSPKSCPTNVPPYFHVMAKPAGSRCNFDCQYCFFLSKSNFYPESSFQMEEDVLEAYIMESQRSDEVTIAWQGGEPTLMGLNFFEKSIGLVRKYLRPGNAPNFTIQTNGSLLDKDCANSCEIINFL